MGFMYKIINIEQDVLNMLIGVSKIFLISSLEYKISLFDNY